MIVIPQERESGPLELGAAAEELRTCRCACARRGDAPGRPPWIEAGRAVGAAPVVSAEIFQGADSLGRPPLLGTFAPLDKNLARSRAKHVKALSRGTLRMKV